MYNSVQLIDCTFFAVSHSPFTFFHALRDCQLGPCGLYISFSFWTTSNFQVIFFNYECFSLLIFKLILPISPVMNIYIYMYIGFKSCLFCFPEDWCDFSAFPCVPMSFDLAGARVVPLMGLGGAAGGDYGFPLQALEVPTWRLGFTGVP